MAEKPTDKRTAPRIDELERERKARTQSKDVFENCDDCFRRLMEATGHGLWEGDAGTGDIDLSPLSWTMLGYQPGEFPANRKSWERLLHPDDKACAERALKELLDGTTEQLRIEFRASAKCGDWKWIRVEGNVAERGDAGVPQRVVGTVQDVSQHKQTEHELKLFQSAIDRASFGCFWIGCDSRITYVNDWACQSLGYSREELLHLPVEDIDPAYPPDVWRAFWKRLLENRVQTFESALRRKDNSRFPTQITANYVELDGREYCCAYVNDISERKQVEKALRENEERLHQAVRVSEIGIFDHDHRTKTIYWSPRQREIHGWGPDEPVDLQAFINLVHPEDLERIDAEVRRAHDPSSDGFWDVEHRIIRRDGSIRWLTARSQTFFEGAVPERHPVRTVGAVRDVTEEKEAEVEREKLRAQLIHAQKMESIGRLAGGVAHDFNNMLSVILGHAGLVLEKLEANSPFSTDLQEIEAAARRSADLTRQLLAFARRQTIAPRVLDLNATVEGTLKMLRRLIGEDIALDWVQGRGLWPVKIDPAQVDQILANLLVNARDAISDEGKVTIETQNVEFDEAYCEANPGAIPGQFVQLAVSDDGRGMSKETLSHVFEPFFTTKDQGQGTGLGLATVYGIVKQNDGFVNVYSEPGKGTTFGIYVPRHAAGPVPAPSESTTSTSAGGTETILLVEDDPMVLELNKTLLEAMGYSVLPALSPAEAIHLAGEFADRIQLLMTDVVMPEMNGRDLAKHLADRLPGLKCLFTSGYTADVIADRGILEEGLCFLQKPVPKDLLAAKVREVLDGK